jgi:polyisoprenoid-binding protein YceI
METSIGTVATLPTPTTATDLPLKPGSWALDRAHARVGFSVRHLGVSKVRGFFAEVDADLVVGSSLDDTAVTASIELASIDTGNTDRDASVRSSDLLDIEQRPAMTFRSTGISGAGEDWTLDGDLTIGNVTKPISLDVEFGGVADFFDGTRHAGFEARGELRRKDFELSFGPLDALVGQVVKLELDLEFIEPA